MNLQTLLTDIIQISEISEKDNPFLANCAIKNICLDSRQIQTGDLFLALRGAAYDGRHFIPAVVAQGAAAIIAEAEQFDPAWKNGSDIPCILVPQLNNYIGQLAARFYGEPSQNLRMIGVTGTNGKTSTTHFIAQALNKIYSEQFCAVVGTVGYGLPSNLQDNTHTTPDAVALQKMLATFVAQKVNAVAMEVSSHALAQNRVQGTHYDIGVFTNLTRDHLDYHGDMASYGAAKQKLFTDFPLRYAVINLDDPFAQTLIAHIPKNVSLLKYSVNSANSNNVDATNIYVTNNANKTNNESSAKADIWANNIKVNRDGIFADLHTPWGEGQLHCNLLGRFHLQNILAVVGALGALNIPFSQILTALPQIQGVAGRMQAFSRADKPLVVVDYAHTPDALLKALATLREITPGKLWCVFGCGGDRDKGKRPIMGNIAEQTADVIVITDDNPRHEDPKLITDEILRGIKNTKKVMVENDRKKAIEYAIQHAGPQDTILVAGKGHETYQQIGDEKLPFDDGKIVAQYIGKAALV